MSSRTERPDGPLLCFDLTDDAAAREVAQRLANQTGKEVAVMDHHGALLEFIKPEARH